MSAMNWDWVRADPAKWCGKEVQINKPDGSLYEFAEGPLFIWDSCEACASQAKVDVSGRYISKGKADVAASVFVQLKGGTCQGNNAQGLHVRVLDNNIWKRLPTGGRDGSYEGTKGTPEGSGPPVIGPGGTPYGTAASQPPGPVRSVSMASVNSLQSGSTASVAPIPSSTRLLDLHNAQTKNGNQRETSIVRLVNSASSTVIVPSKSTIGGEFFEDQPSPTASSVTQATSTLPEETDECGDPIERPFAVPSGLTPGPSASSEGGDCVFGKWACLGDKLQLCGYTAGPTLR